MNDDKNRDKLAKRAKFRQRTILVLLVALAWTYFYMPKFEERQRMEMRLARSKAELSNLETKKQKNHYRLSALRNDPVTIEREIRDNLRWVAPDEVPVLDKDMGNKTLNDLNGKDVKSIKAVASETE